MDNYDSDSTEELKRDLERDLNRLVWERVQQFVNDTGMIPGSIDVPMYTHEFICPVRPLSTPNDFGRVRVSAYRRSRWMPVKVVDL